MPCDLTATKLAACESGIGKLDNPISLLQIIAQLACEIADAGGGSQFISGAGAPAAAPSNPDAPAQYFDTTNDFTYNWNLGTQAWVPVPKVYKALLDQAGTDAPIATVLQNTLGNIVWTRDGVGEYTATLTGAFVLGKFIVGPLLDANGGGVIAFTYNWAFYPGSDDTLILETYAPPVAKTDMGTLGLHYASVIIEVYP